jgi:hypothetical protein
MQSPKSVPYICSVDMISIQIALSQWYWFHRIYITTSQDISLHDEQVAVQTALREIAIGRSLHSVFCLLPLSNWPVFWGVIEIWSICDWPDISEPILLDSSISARKLSHNDCPLLALYNSERYLLLSFLFPLFIRHWITTLLVHVICLFNGHCCGSGSLPLSLSSSLG